jgi:tetratricopeptide (TPR) repeat protein/SAM-dependent methyltransferase
MHRSGANAVVSFSIYKLLKPRHADAPALAREARLAQKLVDRGIAAEFSGNQTKALNYFRQALEADDSYAPAHMNLAIALQASGELPAAMASYEQAIAVDPKYAAAHYNLALMQLLRSQYSEAESGFRTALRFRDDFPEALVGLAAALEAVGRNEDALSALEKAITLRKDCVGALLNSVALLQKMGRLKTAADNSRTVLELEPENHVAHAALGMSLKLLGQLSDAETSYRKALAFNPDYAEAKLELASVLQLMGRNQEAIQLLFDLAANEPPNVQVRRNLAQALTGFALGRLGGRERKVLLSLCLDDGLLSFLNPSIFVSLKGEEGFLILQHDARRGEDTFNPVNPSVTAFLCDPLLLAALPRIRVADVEVEEVLTHARRCILLRFNVKGGPEVVAPGVPTEFICALARQCHVSGYALFADENELQRVTSLLEALQDTLLGPTVNLANLEASLAVASLYGSLDTLTGSERLLECPLADWSEAFRPIVQGQLENPTRERELARKVPSITSIDNEISVAVREQYEESPYPRWFAMHDPDSDTIEKLCRRLRPNQEVRIRPRPVRILVAGCGTGRHPISIAKLYPDSEILAVDLSLTSLGYAMRMTERLGVSNIVYRQADILRLGALDTRFTVVDCCGVLHHLEDPMEGWRILVNLMEPDGLMRIAVYSEKARGPIRAAREFARSQNFPMTPQGVRRCRHAIIKLPDGHPARDVMDFGDFFTLDECRDLIMHVQEHQFTLSRIQECLEQIGLQLLELECTPTVRNRFKEMFPDMDARVNLAVWDKFEDAYPKTFRGMYVFWCCKKQS